VRLRYFHLRWRLVSLQLVTGYREIIAGSGMVSDRNMAEDCQQSYTTAQHFRFRQRLVKLDATQGGA